MKKYISILAGAVLLAACEQKTETITPAASPSQPAATDTTTTAPAASSCTGTGSGTGSGSNDSSPATPVSGVPTYTG